MLFSHLEQLTDGNIPSTKLDFAYGAFSEQLDPTICAEFSQFIVPGLDIPIVP
jgi:hypothetical protein